MSSKESLCQWFFRSFCWWHACLWSLCCNQHVTLLSFAARFGWRWPVGRSITMVFSGKRGWKSHLCTSVYGSWPGHSCTERENTAPWCDIPPRYPGLPHRQLNSPSKLQGIHAETIGFSLWKPCFCKAYLHKSSSAGTGVGWTRLGFLQNERLSASWKTPAFGLQEQYYVQVVAQSQTCPF